MYRFVHLRLFKPTVEYLFFQLSAPGMDLLLICCRARPSPHHGSGGRAEGRPFTALRWVRKCSRLCWLPMVAGDGEVSSRIEWQGGEVGLPGPLPARSATETWR